MSQESQPVYYDSKPDCSGESYTISASDKADDFYFPGGIIQSNYDKPYWNKDTRTWTNANNYIDGLNIDALKTSSTGSSDSTLVLDKVNEQNYKDEMLLGELKKEYCFYRVRYQAYLRAFLDAMNAGDKNAEKHLALLIDLNSKLNAFTTLVDHIANRRSAYINARTNAFNAMNAKLQDEFAAMSTDSNMLRSKESVLNTRKEMIRYTKEKNNSITNHISLWAALNVVAIAMIFHLYRKL